MKYEKEIVEEYKKGTKSKDIIKKYSLSETDFYTLLHKYKMISKAITEKRQRGAKISNLKWGDKDVREKRIVGIEKSYTPQLRKRRSDGTKEQMVDPEQISVRRIKCGGKFLTEVGKTRREVIIEADGKCARCGKQEDRMCIHHKDCYQFHNEKENLVLLCQKCHRIIHTTINRERGRFYGNATIANYIAKAMTTMGLDLTDPNLRETPQRVARLWEEFVTPNKQRDERVKYIMSRKFPSEYNDMVMCNNVKAYGMCPHHLVPIEYTINFAYIPKKYVLGLSKIIDVIKNMCKSPKLQEDLGNDIVETFVRELECQGCICVIEGVHNCMTMRDVEARESSTTTSSVRGCFATNDKNCKGEFLSLIKK